MKATILGMKKFKGEVGEGADRQNYDSTTVFLLMKQDESKGTAKGFAGQDIKFGDSSNYDKFSHLSFPLEAEVEMEMTSNGKGGMKTIVTSIKPLTSPAKPSASAS